MSKDLLYSTGSYIQYLVITYSGKEYKKNIDIYYMKTERKKVLVIQLCRFATP